MFTKSFIRLPARIRWILSGLLLFLLLLTVYRVFFLFKFKPLDSGIAMDAIFLGIRYDLKFISIWGLFVSTITMIPALDPIRSVKIRAIWNGLQFTVCLLLLLLIIADYFHFDYLRQRLNASVLNYLEDPDISFGMVLESYPVFSVVCGTILVAVLILLYFKKNLSRIVSEPPVVKRAVSAYILWYLILAGMVFGKLGQYNLRWSHAFTLGNDFKANLALNPMQSFFSTLKFRKSTYDINAVKELYPLMTQVLGLEAGKGKPLDFERYQSSDSIVGPSPNIVLVICESFSAYKTGIYGNPLRTTPFFDELTTGGLFFNRCFTPAYGTARGVWAVVTGIPDVETPRTASRNPAAVNQRTMLNEFKGYERMYLIGGNPAWANIQGLLANNIDSLRIFMQYDFDVPKVDVWGVSDKNLFLEANKIFRKKDRPFFAIIQTADNHRPYTIPEEDVGKFDMTPVSKDSVRRYGFESMEQLLAFRYADYCFRTFLEAASRERYFNNTIFAFVGDHGVPGDARAFFPEWWTDQNLTKNHTPLLFYAPGRISPAVNNMVCSQIDVIPTLAGLAGMPVRNFSLGRNLLSGIDSNHQAAFIFDNDMNAYGIITGNHYFRKDIRTGKELLFPLGPDTTTNNGRVNEALHDQLRKLAAGYYESSRYLLLNNRRQ
jgi:phosphoglycerol transferase MdoB-like AlkP superfamily enzyme